MSKRYEKPRKRCGNSKGKDDERYKSFFARQKEKLEKIIGRGGLKIDPNPINSSPQVIKDGRTTGTGTNIQHD